MLQPTVSIGLPVYNGENYLAEALRSILDQGYKDFELIVSDNASIDATRDICRRFAEKDPRVRYYRQGENMGASPNYNLLVEHARGRYFKWAAHDDNLLPGFLERCVDALDSDPDAVLAYPLTAVIDGNGKNVGKVDDGLGLLDIEPHKRLTEYLKRNFIRQRGLCNPIFGLVRIDSLRRTRLIQDFPGSDLILLAHLSMLGRFVAINDVLFSRRVHPGISTAAYRSNAERRVWFNSSSRAKRVVFDNDLSLRVTHIRELYRAISELINKPAERRRCRWALTSLLLCDPKWLYIDLKYSFGLRPSWSDSLKRIESQRDHYDGSAL